VPPTSGKEAIEMAQASCEMAYSLATSNFQFTEDEISYSHSAQHNDVIFVWKMRESISSIDEQYVCKNVLYSIKSREFEFEIQAGSL